MATIKRCIHLSLFSKNLIVTKTAIFREKLWPFDSVGSSIASIAIVLARILKVP